jgi:hypothetical protein
MLYLWLCNNEICPRVREQCAQRVSSSLQKILPVRNSPHILNGKKYVTVLPSVPVAVRSKVQVCGRLVSGVLGSNPARDMGVCLLCLLSCVGRGLCDGLITRPEESYSVSNCMCDYRNPERGPMF